MLLSNFYKAQGAAVFGKQLSSSDVYSSSLKNTYNIGLNNAPTNSSYMLNIYKAGLTTYAGSYNAQDFYSAVKTAYSTTQGHLGSGPYGGTMVFILPGTGTTPPTVNDYKLETPIFSLDLIGISNGEGMGTGTLVTAYQNNTLNIITITELGIVAATSVKTSASALLVPNMECVQLSREVLTTPIVMKPGDIKSLSITIQYTQNTSVSQ